MELYILYDNISKILSVKLVNPVLEVSTNFHKYSPFIAILFATTTAKRTFRALKLCVSPHNAEKNVARENGDLIFLLGRVPRKFWDRRRAIPHEIGRVYAKHRSERGTQRERTSERTKERKQERKKRERERERERREEKRTERNY
jgi:hypothetical protein